MTWEWDPTLYAGSAPHYARGRLGYPPELAEALAAELGLDGTGRLLDVGCGPGSLTLLLAPLVAEAVGLDADPGMLAEAAEAGAPNVRWVHLRAEELPAGLGRFRLVTFAQSFHWMQRERVAAAVRGMLEPGGTLVHVHANTSDGIDATGPVPHPEPPRAAIEDLVRAYLGPVRRAGQGVLAGGTPAGEDAIYRAAGFTGPRRIELPGRVVERTADQVVDAVLSLSSSAPHLFGPRLPDFEADLRRLLTTTSPPGLFSQQMRQTALHLWTP